MGDNRLPVRDASVIGRELPIDENLESEVCQTFAKLGEQDAIDHASPAQGDAPDTGFASRPHCLLDDSACESLVKRPRRERVATFASTPGRCLKQACRFTVIAGMRTDA